MERTESPKGRPPGRRFPDHPASSPSTLSSWGSPEKRRYLMPPDGDRGNKSNECYPKQLPPPPHKTTIDPRIGRGWECWRVVACHSKGSMRAAASTTLDVLENVDDDDDDDDDDEDDGKQGLRTTRETKCPFVDLNRAPLDSIY
jgi:hypothetical protein